MQLPDRIDLVTEGAFCRDEVRRTSEKVKRTGYLESITLIASDISGKVFVKFAERFDRIIFSS